jgi:hypothetical protein
VLSALRGLRSAIDALIAIVGAIPTNRVAPDSVVDRLEEAFFSWANLRPELNRAGADREMLDRLDRLFTATLRLTTNDSLKRSYNTRLEGIREVLAGGLNDFAIRNTLLLPPSPPRASAALLLPEVSDLPNELVPRGVLGFLPTMKEFLRRSPFENNVFIMVAFRRRLVPLINEIKVSIRELGLNPVIANETHLADTLDNPIACLLCCKYGVAIFDRGEEGQTHNANVVYEVATMHLLKRPCVLLKNRALRNMPSDFLHRLYEPYRTLEDARASIRRWWESLNQNV